MDSQGGHHGWVVRYPSEEQHLSERQYVVEPMGDDGVNEIEG